MEQVFLYALIWSTGATTDNEGRVKFDKWLRDLIKVRNLNPTFPEEGTVYDWEFNKAEKKYVAWAERFENFSVDSKHAFHEIVIPTSDSTRMIYLKKLLIKNNFHIIVPGPTGTGKTLNIMTLLTKELDERY